MPRKLTPSRPAPVRAVRTGRRPTAGSAAERDDGRRLRAARNREAVVTAVLEIIRDQGGGPLPGAAEVAERAGVSERTVFRHFADLDTMFLAAAARQRPFFVEYLGPRPEAKELDRRIASVVRLRSKLYEEIAPVRRVAVRLATHHDVVAAQVGEANRAARAQLAVIFEPELSRAGSLRSTVLDEIDLATSWAAWDTLRTQGASPERARKVMTELLTAVLKPLGGGRRSRS